MAKLTEDYMVEQSALDWLKELGYSYVHGSELSQENNERESYRDVILKKRFINAINKMNTWLSNGQADEIYKKVVDIDHPDFLVKSKMFYEMLCHGVKIPIREGKEDKTRIAKIFDFEQMVKNEFLVANQYSVEYQFQKGMYRRPDVVIFVNGIPLVVFEFKNFSASETAKDAFYDHKTKKEDIPQLYVYAQVLVASDGLETKYGSITSDWDRYFVWEGIFDDEDLEARKVDEDRYYYIFKPEKREMTSLEVLINGLLRKEHISEYLLDFVFYDKSGETFAKMIAMFQQFYVVRKAVNKTIETVIEGRTPEDKRVGIVWHTQGTGKSLTMLFYARKALKVDRLENPLLLFITDRNNLDEQLYNLFAALPIAKQAESISELQELLKEKSGGIIFATIQKFGKNKAEEYPLLTKRSNIIVIADEAHRSQYRELAMNLRKAIPNASFLGFTATPIELVDRSTKLVFGEHLSIYSMEKAKRHGVIVPIFYEARLAELHLTNEFIDEEFEEISEEAANDPDTKQALKKKYARLEKLMMSEERLDKIAKDIIHHFNSRTQEFEGKALVVAISRRVAVKLYDKISKQPNAPSVIVVMSGNKNKDPKEYWPHLRNNKETKELQEKFRDPDSGPDMAIVVDMWLTGYDVPCMNTMYFDKPMKDHSLVQAITRVNRVFKDKPGGLIVDYIGIADNLRKSLSIYSSEYIKEIVVNIDEVINMLREKYDVVSAIFHGLSYKDWNSLKPVELSKLTTLAYDRISRDEEIKKRFIKNYVALKKLYALGSPHPETYKIRNDIRFFEMIKKMVVKYSIARIRDINRDLEYEINHLISKSIAAEEPLDVFSLMGKEKPEISIFDEKFLSQFKDMKFKNYAAELLAKIIRDELFLRTRNNPFRYQSLSDMMKKIIEKYNVKLIDTAEVIEELIKIAHEIKRAVEDGKKLNLSDEELAFYDLLSTKDGIWEKYEEVEEVAKAIVKELGYYIKVADWNRKEYIKAKIKAAVKNAVINVIDGRISYNLIDQLSLEVMNHAMTVYAGA